MTILSHFEEKFGSNWFG